MKKIRLERWIFLGILVIYFASLIVIRAVAAGITESHIEGIEELGTSLDEFKIPTDVKVVGIGEATHGNCEFQTAKLLVLKKLAEEGKSHAIAFEMSAGEAAAYNAAIHESDSDLDELLGKTDYPLYDTQQMLELLTWMREYNLSHSEEESLMFYGVDMQGDLKEIAYLNGFCHDRSEGFSEEELDKLSVLAVEEEPDTEAEREFFDGLYVKLSSFEGSEYRIAESVARALLQWIDAPSFSENPDEYGEYRDRCMAENLQNYYDIEANRGYPQILITAHNGHVMKGDNLGYGDRTMGNRITELFEGSYYCIGTEFYNTVVNIHTAGTYDEAYKREDHEYCSEDVLAYQAKYFDEGSYCLDFASVSEKDGRVYKLLHNPNFTGAAGEGYNLYMDLYKTYRAKLVAADHYDAMIYYYETTPIRVRHY